jgi:RNA polymerase sigma factor (sigma-70 family)
METITLKETVNLLTTKTDQELISECLCGNAAAWEVLIERYRSLVYSITLKYRFSEYDADDIFQSTCLKLLEKLPDLRNYEKFRSWLITTVVRQCWRMQKRQRQEISSFNLFEGDDKDSMWNILIEISLDEGLVEIERHHQIETAFSRLPDRCQQLLNHLFLYDPPTSYKEISEQMGINFTSIAPTRSRCLEKLKQLFQEESKQSKEIKRS